MAKATKVTRYRLPVALGVLAAGMALTTGCKDEQPGVANGEAPQAAPEGDEEAATSGDGAEETGAASKKQVAGTPKETEDEAGSSGKSAVPLHPELAETVETLIDGFEAIPADRKKQLKKLALFVETKQSSGEPAQLTFICTHNSRRSHMSQLWAATAAAYYGLDGVETYSGGTESTAFNPRAVAAIERAGFQVKKPEDAGENPRYQVSFSPEAEAQTCFSKKYDHPENPQENFAAVMTCSEADKNCPTVEGATLRVGVPYVDPKESDGTPEEAATYDARAKQIGTEMFYLMSQVDTPEG